MIHTVTGIGTSTRITLYRYELHTYTRTLHVPLVSRIVYLGTSWYNMTAVVMAGQISGNIPVKQNYSVSIQNFNQRVAGGVVAGGLGITDNNFYNTWYYSSSRTTYVYLYIQ